MVTKALVGTLRDTWARRNMPKQLRARDTRMAFTDIIVRNSIVVQIHCC